MITPTIDKARQCLSDNGWELNVSQKPASDEEVYTVWETKKNMDA